MAEVVYTVEKQVNRKNWQISSYSTSREIADELRVLFGGGVTEVRPDDWQPTSEVGVQTQLKIRDVMVITEAENEVVWESVKSEFPDRLVLSFPPQLAFGTGGHPTTSGCLRFLADVAKERKDVEWRLLDLGCGSAILAVAAVLLGAKEVIAVENDPLAMKYARRNAERHGVAGRIKFVEGDAIALMDRCEFGQFEVVAANLFSDLLIQLFPLFPRNLVEGGEIIVSGFLTSQTRLVTDSADSSGLPLSEFQRRGKWVAALGKKE
jgi:ribosomal protein L11 methyltransferase